MSFITPEELRVAFESFAAQINRANDAHTRNNEIQTLLTLETTEMLLAAVQTVNLDLHTLVGALIEKGILTGEEWQYKQAETAAAIQIETAVDPEWVRANEALLRIREDIAQLRAKLRET